MKGILTWIQGLFAVAVAVAGLKLAMAHHAVQGVAQGTTSQGFDYQIGLGIFCAGILYLFTLLKAAWDDYEHERQGTHHG